MEYKDKDFAELKLDASREIEVFRTEECLSLDARVR